MKQLLRFRVLALLLLCAAVCRAEGDSLKHEFHVMSKDASQLSFSSSDKVGVTPLVTYTCTGTNAKFGVDVSYKKYISINLPDANDFVTTSAIEDVAGIEIWHYPQTTCSNITIQLSRDSVHWTDAIIQDGMYRATRIVASFVPGRYYVRLTNTTSKSVSLYKIIYRFGSGCNCVLYIPE